MAMLHHSARNPGMGYGTVNYDSSAPEYELENTLVCEMQSLQSDF
jgi:hypothetical protein